MITRSTVLSHALSIETVTVRGSAYAVERQKSGVGLTEGLEIFD